MAKNHRAFRKLSGLDSSNFSEQLYLIGQAKQILQYRNWIAHGKNVNKIPPQVTPIYAFDILNEIVDLMLLISERSLFFCNDDSGQPQGIVPT